MAKLNREAAVRERRQLKKMKKDARKQALLVPASLETETETETGEAEEREAGETSAASETIEASQTSEVHSTEVL